MQYSLVITFKNMNTLKKILKSRTNYTLLAMFIYNGVIGIQAEIPAEYQVLVNALLMLLAGYFKIKPSECLKNRHVS